MVRGFGMIALGLVLVVFRRWIARYELEYRRRYDMEFFKDVRTRGVITLVMGIGMVCIGFLVLVLTRSG